MSPPSAYVHQNLRLLRVRENARSIYLVEIKYIWGAVLNVGHLALMSEHGRRGHKRVGMTNTYILLGKVRIPRWWFPHLRISKRILMDTQIRKG
jgi:hypothetical protein